jgi:hypothetical protein
MRFVDGQIVQEDGEVDMHGFLHQIEGKGVSSS